MFLSFLGSSAQEICDQFRQGGYSVLTITVTASGKTSSALLQSMETGFVSDPAGKNFFPFCWTWTWTVQQWEEYSEKNHRRKSWKSRAEMPIPVRGHLARDVPEGGNGHDTFPPCWRPAASNSGARKPSHSFLDTTAFPVLSKWFIFIHSNGICFYTSFTSS